METTVVGSIILATGTVMAAIGHHAVPKLLERKNTGGLGQPSNKYELQTLEGSWIGYLDQKTGRSDLIEQHKITIKLLIQGKNITGKMTLDIKAVGKPIKCDIANILYYGRILKMDYINNDDLAVHFGTLHAQLSSDGKVLRGKFLGYGLLSEMLVDGNAFLERT